MQDETTIALPDGIVLHADVGEPARPPLGTVVFAHGSGSSRHSPRNRHVADLLRRSGLQTVLLDLLTQEEEREDMRSRALRFDIELLADRVAAAAAWAHGLGGEPIGLFGASTGAAAALVAAARRPAVVGAVVSRGGRPDLAADLLDQVESPTLLIVGGLDGTVLRMNREALAGMRTTTALEVVAGAGHLFAEPGALDEVARHASAWFVRYLSAAAAG